MGNLWLVIRLVFPLLLRKPLFIQVAVVPMWLIIPIELDSEGLGTAEVTAVPESLAIASISAPTTA